VIPNDSEARVFISNAFTEMYHHFIGDCDCWPLVRGTVFFFVVDIVAFSSGASAIDAKQMSIIILIVYNFNKLLWVKFYFV